MNDYTKWDKMQDSDEEETNPHSRESQADDHDKLLQDQAITDQWLRRQMNNLYRSEPGKTRIPELQETAKYRRVTEQERKVLAMLIVMSHFDEGSTNLNRHPQLLELFRHHRWLATDPGTLELLCRVHNQSMRRAGELAEQGEEQLKETPHDIRMRNMILSAINTIAAPQRAGCPGGLLELVNMICTPATEHARELRIKWQKKEFAKDALFDSLFPDSKHFASDNAKDTGLTEVWIFIGVLVLLIFVVVVALYTSGSPPASLTTTTTLTLISGLHSGDLGNFGQTEL